MARIEETVLVIKLSQLRKDNDNNDVVGYDDLLPTIEEVVQQLVASDVVVEVIKA
jgi:hypothetical protein